MKSKNVVQKMNINDSSILEKEMTLALSSFGLNQEEAKIYLCLLRWEEATVLEVSRLTSLNRTNVYRLCEKLQKDGFLSKDPRFKTTKYSAVNLDFLRTKIDELKTKAERAKTDLKTLTVSVEKLIKSKNAKIKVLHYVGKEEICQLLWNVTRAKTEVKGFGYRTLSEITGKLFIVRWWNELTRRGIVTKIIANPGTLTFKESVDHKTKEKYVHRNPLIYQKVKHLWLVRIMDKKLLTINQETFIYNDIYSLVQWDEKQAFGVEIYNQAVKNEQEAIFDILWRMAKPYRWEFQNEEP